MKQKRLLLLPILWTLLAPSVAMAEDVPAPKSAERMLTINNSMLKRFETEYKNLSQHNNPDPETLKKIDSLKYKIKSLKEDSLRLQSAVPQQRIEQAPKPEASKPVMANILHEKALDYVAESNFTEAAKVYKEIVLSHPEDDEAYVLMGHCYLLSGKYDEAKLAFANAIHISTDNIREITSFYENLILQDPYDDSARTHLGYACLILGDNRRAEESFKDALEINPSNEQSRQGYLIAQSR